MAKRDAERHESGRTRITVAFDPDIAAAIEELMREEGISVSEATNRLAREGMAAMDDTAEQPLDD